MTTKYLHVFSLRFAIKDKSNIIVGFELCYILLTSNILTGYATVKAATDLIIFISAVTSASKRYL